MTIQQAEAELRAAALAFSIADAEYRRQWKINGEGDKKRDADGCLAEELSPGTKAALHILHARQDELHAAAKAFDAAVVAEHRAEAL